ncbi:MAG: hypothetical protein KDK36_21530 [Leptospiraceae bacterium]|nr:hypothetical protein [Leptospiraceae bacterium]
MERINSIQFRLNNPLDGNYNEVVSPFIEMASQSSGTSSRSSFSPLPKTKIDLAIEDFINKHKEVIKCSTVLSPASGVTFDELREGQKLLFKLPFRTPEEKSKARRLGGVNKLGQPITITGTFLRLIVGPKDEYHIFAKGPHGVLLRAFEERPVRLAVPRYSEAGEGLEKNSKAMWIVAIGFLIFIAVLGVIYFL